MCIIDHNVYVTEEPNVLNEVPKVSDSGRATQMLQSDPATQKQEDPEVIFILTHNNPLITNKTSLSYCVSIQKCFTCVLIAVL